MNQFRRHVAAKTAGMQAIALPGVGKSVMMVGRNGRWTVAVECEFGRHAERAELYAVGYNEASAR